MDLRKARQKAKKFNREKPEFYGYDVFAGFHIYRSQDMNAPFSEWERITEKPRREKSFTDENGKAEGKTYYYKITEVDIFGNESLPYLPEKQYWIKDGKQIERTPETTIVGVNYYWSEDRNLPLDQWKKLNQEVVREEKQNFDCPIKTRFYIYAKYVNELGNEFGRPSDIQEIIPRP
jgi:hypothetical protein